MLPDVRRKPPASADGERLLTAWAAAEARLDEAAAHLRHEEEALLDGASLDENRFDRLVCAYLHAQREALGARRAWRRWQTQRTAGGAAAVRAGAAVPTPRLQFARWLYLHGRIAG
jgi:hypothetical protein